MRPTSFSSRFARLMPSPSLRLRLILRLLGLLLLLLLIGGAAVIALVNADRRMSGLVTNALSPVAAVGRIQNDYNDSLNALTHASLTRLPSAVDEAKTLIQSNRLEIERYWKTLQASGLGQQQAQLLSLADVHRKAAEQVMDEAIKLLETEQFDLAQLQVASDVQPSFAPLHADFANLFAKALQTGDDAAATEHATSLRTLGYLLALLVIGLLTAVTVDSLLIRTVTRRLDQAVKVAQRIAAGDLGHRYETGNADEIGSLLRALQQMEGRLCMVVGDVQRGAERVHAAAEQLAQGNDALSKRTQAQATGLEQASTSMTHMTHAVQRNADSAIRANQLASAAREQAKLGSGMVTETRRSMSAIGEAGQRMADIISTIDTLAFQTRLLALNAAVEAAHAGAHGRGFAVVAEEVRQLAQRSTDAAREIHQLIDDSAMKVEAGTLLADRSSHVLAEIVESTARVSQAIADISANSREQSTGIGQIGQTVLLMDDATQQNAGLVEKAAASGRALREQADVLLRQIGFFQLNETATMTDLLPEAPSPSLSPSRPVNATA